MAAPKVWQFILFGLLAGTGCSTVETDPAIRRAGLLEMYPPGKTTRADVQQKWAPSQPKFSRTRPDAGWDALGYPGVTAAIAASEARTGVRVQRVECYIGADGLFGLARVWFYFDEVDHVCDVEYQYQSD